MDESEASNMIIQFDSDRKTSSIIVRYPEWEGSNKEVRVYTKGAMDFLMKNVTKVNYGQDDV